MAAYKAGLALVDSGTHSGTHYSLARPITVQGVHGGDPPQP